jgi:hypothetical protein
MPQTGDNIDDLQDRFYEEFEHVFRKFPKLCFNFALECDIRKVQKNQKELKGRPSRRRIDNIKKDLGEIG